MTHSTSSATEIRLQEAAQTIKSFHERFGEAHIYLAYHAALPIAITPHLLQQFQIQKFRMS